MKKNLFILLLLLCCLATQAQDDSRQVLVFRHSGAVDLFYHEQLDSIFCSYKDTLGVGHDSIVSQIFYTKDSAYVIPIADIDSVVFGNRNEIEYKQEVKVLTAEDVSWIIRIEENTIYFKSNTPSNVLPRLGDKLFYPEITEMFPIGLAVVVTNVATIAGEIAVTIESVDLADIFDRFFYAGQIEQTIPAGVRRAPQFSADFEIKGNINIGSYGSIKVNGGVNIEGAAVIQPLQHYYRVDMQVRPYAGFAISIGKESKAKLKYDKELWHQALPTVAMLFVPSIECFVFYELEASMKFNYEMQRGFYQRIIWTRIDGQNTIQQPNRGDTREPTDHAKIDVTLDGSFYFGVGLNINFCLIGDVLGVRTKTRLGPELSGSMSVEVLNNLSSQDYDANTYISGELKFANRLNFEACLLHREHGIFGDVVEKFPFFSTNIRFNQRTINLFPHFKASRAVRETSKNSSQKVSFTTKTQTELARPLKTGFQILNENAEVLQTDFVDTLKNETTELQGIAAVAELETNVNTNDTIAVRPVFKYDGHIIPYAAVSAAQEPGVMPVITYMSKDLITIISGAPIIGATGNDTITLHIGNYLPVPFYDVFFVPYNPYVATIPYIANSNPIYGTWKGEIDGDQTTLAINENNTGKYIQGNTERTFRYALNTPSDGNMLLLFDDNTSRTFYIKSISAIYLVLRDKKTNNNIKLIKTHLYETY